MGLMAYAVRFPGGAPPPEEEFRRALKELVGSLSALESYEVEGDTARIMTMMQPVLGPYAVKLLLGRGGEYVDPFDGQPRPIPLPAFTERPWRSWPWLTRARIHLGFHAALLAPSRPAAR